MRLLSEGAAEPATPGAVVAAKALWSLCAGSGEIAPPRVLSYGELAVAATRLCGVQRLAE